MDLITTRLPKPVLFALIPALALQVPGMAQTASQPTSKPAEKPAVASDIPKDTEIKTTKSGLQYSVLEASKSGMQAASGDLVEVHYTGWLKAGKKFDSSRDRDEPFRVLVGQGSVIPGWDEGLALMAPGSRFKFTIPAKLAYGPRGRPPRIPPESSLIFDVKMLSVLCRSPKFAKMDAEKTKKLKSGVSCEVLEEGAGPAAVTGDVFEFSFSFWDEKGELLDSSAKHTRTLKGKTEAFRLKFLKEVAPTMRVGQVVRLEVPAGQAIEDENPVWQKTTFWQLRLIKTLKPLPVPEFTKLDDKKKVTTNSGLSYQVIKAGTGKQVGAQDMVRVHYCGWLPSGKVFDNSYERGEPATFQLFRVIPGWREGIQTMKEGGTSLFHIPAKLAYGPQGSAPTIGPNQDLIFMVKVIKVLGQ